MVPATGAPAINNVAAVVVVTVAFVAASVGIPILLNTALPAVPDTPVLLSVNVLDGILRYRPVVDGVPDMDPEIVKVLPKKDDFATARPPPNVAEPPFVAETASVVFPIAREPDDKTRAPVELLVLAVALLKVTIPEAAIVVAAVPDPIAPGLANVFPFRLDAFKLATFVVDATVNGAVPVEIVLVKTPDADIVVNAPELATVLPMEPGLANVLPFNVLAFKLGTFVVDATVNGAVPVLTVLVNEFAVVVLADILENKVVPP